MTSPQKAGLVGPTDTASAGSIPPTDVANRPPHRRSKRGGWVTLGLLVAVVVACGVGLFLPFPDEVVGLLAVVMMLGLIFLKFPVAIALGAPGLLGTWALRGWQATQSGLTSLPYDTTAQWSLSVIPMFVLMGLLLWRSGVTTNLYTAGRQWLGWLPGGLAVGTNFAGGGLAAVSGSSVGTTYALGRIGIPEMLKAGYDRRLALASVVLAGIGGQLMPPSILLVIYAGIAQVPVGPQLIAGVGPGALVVLVFGTSIVGLCMLRPQLTRAREPVPVALSWTERWRSLRSVWPVPVLIGIIIGGMFSGLLTATEAGAAAAAGALLLTLLWKRGDRPFAAVAEAAASTVSTAGAIFFLLIGATLLSRMLTLSGLTSQLAGLVDELGLGPVQFLLLMVVLYFIMGMFMDPLAMMLLTVPILMPTLETLGVSLLWFGTFVVFMGEVAIVTPPVGILAYIIHGITQDPEVNQGVDISMKDTFVAVGWFMPIFVVIAVLLILVPQISTYLPSLSN